MTTFFPRLHRKTLVPNRSWGVVILAVAILGGIMVAVARSRPMWQAIVTPGLTTATLVLLLLVRRRQVQSSQAIHQVLENVTAELRAGSGPQARDDRSRASQNRLRIDKNRNDH